MNSTIHKKLEEGEEEQAGASENTKKRKSKNKMKMKSTGPNVRTQFNDEPSCGALGALPSPSSARMDRETVLDEVASKYNRSGLSRTKNRTNSSLGDFSPATPTLMPDRFSLGRINERPACPSAVSVEELHNGGSFACGGNANEEEYQEIHQDLRNLHHHHHSSTSLESPPARAAVVEPMCGGAGSPQKNSPLSKENKKPLKRTSFMDKVFSFPCHIPRTSLGSRRHKEEHDINAVISDAVVLRERNGNTAYSDHNQPSLLHRRSNTSLSTALLTDRLPHTFNAAEESADIFEHMQNNYVEEGKGEEA